MTTTDTIQRITDDLEAIDEVLDVDGHEWDTAAGYKIRVIMDDDAGMNAALVDVLEKYDLRIWWVGFDADSLALVPADEFQWRYPK